MRADRPPPPPRVIQSLFLELANLQIWNWKTLTIMILSCDKRKHYISHFKGRLWYFLKSNKWAVVSNSPSKPGWMLLWFSVPIVGIWFSKIIANLFLSMINNLRTAGLPLTMNLPSYGQKMNSFFRRAKLGAVHKWRHHFWGVSKPPPLPLVIMSWLNDVITFGGYPDPPPPPQVMTSFMNSP